MPRNRISAETWEKVRRAYEEWDHLAPDAVSVTALLAPFGVKKQSWYNYAHKHGIALKTRPVGPQVPAGGTTDTVNALLKAWMDGTLRIAALEERLRRSGLPTD